MIGKLNHVAIVVPDLAAGAQLYREGFGADVSEPVDLPAQGVTTVFVNQVTDVFCTVFVNTVSRRVGHHQARKVFTYFFCFGF